MTRDEVLKTARFAGSIRRYHTWPVLQQQTNGEHTWNCMRIYFQIWGPIPPEVSTYFIWHDAGELVLGDLPFPVKQNHSHLKRECDYIESQAVTDMGGDKITLIQSGKRAKLCDLLDMHEFGKVEVNLGNQYGVPIVADTQAAIVRLLDEMPLEDRRLVDDYRSRVGSV